MATRRTRTARKDASREPASADEPAVDPEPHDGEVHMWPLRNGLYMLVGDEGNIVVQIGDEGHSWSIRGAGRLSDKTMAAIRKLSNKPIQFIANTKRAEQPAATSCFARLELTPAFEDPSSHCSSPMRASGPRYCRIRTCKTG